MTTMSGSADDASAEDLATASLQRIGTTLADKWTLEELLGVGGMAAVYGARHRNGKSVAIKVLHPHLRLAPAVKRRFLREGHVANRVGHPNAVSILDDGVTVDDEPFLVMERLLGETLESRRARAGTLQPVEAVRVACGVLEVLSAAHAKGVIHRDIKPENVFLTTDEAVKVLDFGIASLRDAAAATDSLATHPGTARGTPAFMAPEQARGGTSEIDARTDVWATGALLFSVLSGRTVHEGQSTMQVLFLAGTQPARKLATVAPEIPEALASVVDRALAFDAEDRFASADEMRAALEAAKAALQDVSRPRDVVAESATVPEVSVDVPPSVHPASARPGGARRGLLVALAASATVLLLWAALRPSPSRREPTETAPRAPAPPSREPDSPAAAETRPAPPEPRAAVEAVTSAPIAPSAPRAPAGEARKVGLPRPAEAATPAPAAPAPAAPPAPPASAASAPRDIFERRR